MSKTHKTHFDLMTNEQLSQRQQQLRAEIAIEEALTDELTQQRTQKNETIDRFKNQIFPDLNNKFREAGVGYFVDFNGCEGCGDYPQLKPVEGDGWWKKGQGRLVRKLSYDATIKNAQESMERSRARNAKLLTKNDGLERELIEKRAQIKATELEWENDLAEGTALPEASAAEKKARFKAKKAVKNAKRKRSRMEANL